MKFVSYEHDGNKCWGLVDGESVISLDSLAPSLKQAIAADLLPKALDEIDNRDNQLPLRDVRLLCPVPDPQRIICVGQNYAAHREEMKGAVTSYPLLFTRFPSSLLGHGATLAKPAQSEEYDFEGELAVIIGKAGRHIEKKDALSHIAGYSCFMDGSVRDFQNHTTQYIPGKNFDHSGAFGPWMLSADKISDPNAGLRLQTKLNDEIVQETTTDLMLFTIPTVIAYISTFTQLQAGDVIASGTPGGVGYMRDPQLFMKPGDKIEVVIEEVATLTNFIG